MKVRNTGLCLFTTLEVATTQCFIDIGNFPFDQQICSLEFESLSFTVNQLNITLLDYEQEYGTDLRLLQRSTEWHVIG